MLAEEGLRLSGLISCQHPQKVTPALLLPRPWRDAEGGAGYHCKNCDQGGTSGWTDCLSCQIYGSWTRSSKLGCNFRYVSSLSRVRLCVTPWTVAYEAPLSMEFSRQEYWSGLPFPSPGDLPHLGIEPWSPALQADALPSKPPGKAFQVPSAVFRYSLLRRSQPAFPGPHCSQSIGTS